MFNKDEYLAVIKHKSSQNGDIETSNLKAFKLDDDNGIAVNIGFSPNMLKKVDYFLEDNHAIQLIELSDLRNQFNNCASEIKVEIEKIQTDNDKGTYKTKKIKEAKRKAWQQLTDEFFKKWSGSIAVIERLYRKTNQSPDIDPNYCLLIVCVNETDIQILQRLNDEFANILNGMMGKVMSVKVIKTNQLSHFVIAHL
ncbi:hypothetical protein DOJK_00513 [Patescibacteria group bacterium]|nr:hypothetical protein DOJK_00513 [Patescibacteria group bacterium]